MLADYCLFYYKGEMVFVCVCACVRSRGDVMWYFRAISVDLMTS